MNICNTLFLPYINYCCIIQRCACHSVLGPADMIQRRVLEAIHGVSRCTSTRYIYDEMKVFTVSHLFEIQVFIFTYKYGNHMLPHPLLGLFQTRDEMVSKITKCDTDLNHVYYVHPQKLSITEVLYL